MTRVVVIGGGIAGVSAAAALGQAGFQVLVLEAEAALGTHASGRSAAMFEENYGNEVIRALNKATGPELKRRGVLSPRGIMMVALDAERAQFEADLDAMGMDELPLEEAHRMVPVLSQDIVRAALHEGAMDIDTDRLLQSFAKEARSTGAELVCGAAVDAISPGQVRAGGAEVQADIVVNAAGAWADQVGQMAGAARTGLQPYRRSMARLPAPGGHDVQGWPMLFGPGESWYAKPDAGGWIVSPADEDPVDPMDAWADDMVLAEGLARYEAHVSVPVSRVETNWAGLRSFVPDRSLVIGKDPDVPGFCWLAGQGGYGFQTCVAAARHLVEVITGQASTLGQSVGERLSPARFGQAKVGV